eukprot:TRINITY_DN275_c0_g1_i1.p1 TRINITY_DN275_c0_g1~~TRINITY_DN275_c0_g1_i1.p1  ORF type:complete len:304 (+),score=66.88 TRINITY_DN275_c0_g1_i1:55-966(+)
MEFSSNSPTGDVEMTDEYWISTPPTPARVLSPPESEAVAFHTLRIPSKDPILNSAVIALEPFDAVMSPPILSQLPSHHHHHHHNDTIPEFEHTGNIGFKSEEQQQMYYEQHRPIPVPFQLNQESQEQPFSYPDNNDMSNASSIDFVVNSEVSMVMPGVGQDMISLSRMQSLENALMGQIDAAPAPMSVGEFEVPRPPSGTYSDWGLLDIPSNMEMESQSANVTPVSVTPSSTATGYVSDSSVAASERVSSRTRRVCRYCAKDHKPCVGNPCSRCIQRGKECVFDAAKVPGPKPKTSPSSSFMG